MHAYTQKLKQLPIFHLKPPNCNPLLAAVETHLGRFTAGLIAGVGFVSGAQQLAAAFE